jgi:hypothetical protein
MTWEMLAPLGKLAPVVFGIPSLIYLVTQIRHQTKERQQAVASAGGSAELLLLPPHLQFIPSQQLTSAAPRSL